jgi:hypothetical protein
MLIRKLVVLSAAVFSLTACDQISGKHDIVRAGNQTFLINRATGEAKLIDGTTLVAVKALEPTASGEPFKKAKTWPEQSINDLQGVKFKLRTKYRDGAILWTIVAGPFPGELEKVYKATQPGSMMQPTVMFELYDDEGFKTGEAIELKIRQGSRTVNSKNEVMELNWSGTHSMTPDTYSAAVFVNTRWYGFK